MMKKISVIIWFLICSIFVLGQNEAKEWQVYESPKDDFTVEIPQKFEENFEILKDIDDKEIYISAKYKIQTNDSYFYVFSEVIQDKKSELNELPFSELTKFIQANSAKLEKKKIGNFVGELYSFKDSEDYFHKILIIKTEKRGYIFHTFSAVHINKELDHFIDSIKFRKIEDLKTSKTRATINAEKSNVVPIADSGDGKASGQREGSGSGGNRNNSNSTPPIQTTPVQQTNSPLKILSKPRAIYTDLARIYQISGSILLRVTFLANGEIGEVNPKSSLPFGLTNNSIKAVKLVRFQPEIRNGVPTTVIKQVQYNFTLY